MIKRRLPKGGGLDRATHRDMPPPFVEYSYYFSLLYSIMGPTWGLSIPYLGAGTLAILAAYCVFRLRSREGGVYEHLAMPLAFAISFLFIQLTFHDESLMNPNNRSFVVWMLTLIIIQWTALRPGFLHRFARITFLIGLVMLLYLQTRGGTYGYGVERAALEAGVGIANANDLAAWFGFCTVYFFVAGYEAKRPANRMIAWAVSIGCLYVVGLTVSRGVLIAILTAIVVAFRGLLKRGFLPVLLLIGLFSAVWSLGIFERSIELYSERGSEETGRLTIWPIVIEQFLESPFVGVGISNISLFAPGRPRPITPHNVFLLIALASGIIPFVLFVLYNSRAVKGAIMASTTRPPDWAFYFPLLTYGFLILLQLNWPFMSPWFIVTVATAMTHGIHDRAHRALARLMVGHSVRNQTL